MMRTRLSIAAALLALSACVKTPATPATAAAAPALDRFEAEILAFEAADRASPPAPGGVVLYGSSSLRLWPDAPADFPGAAVTNRGFGGSTFPEAIHYYERVVLPRRPRLIVLYEGDNDLADGRTPAQVAADYRAFARLVRRTLPDARLAFVSIKPSPSRWALIDRAREANRLVRAEAARDPRATFVDVFAPMLRADGRPRPELFGDDSLHMTRAGYDLWKARLAPVVR